MTTRHWWRNHPNALLRFLALSISFTLASLTCFQTPLPAASRRISFYHTDYLGSTTLVTDDQGRVVSHTDYAPYGATVQQTGTPAPAHQFTGQRLDAETGLYYYKARYYDPQLGRFIQPDSIVQAPADPQTLNRYSYVRNNPVNFVDPSGHFFFLAFLGALLVKAAIGAAVGAALNATVAAFTDGNIGKAALVGAVGGAIFGAGGAITSFSAFQGATAAAIVGRAMVMGTAGALAGLSGAGMTGQPLGRGAGIGAVLGVLGVVAPTPNVPWLGYGPLAERINPILNSMLSGAVLGGGVAAIQGESIGRGALGGAFYNGLGTAFNVAYDMHAGKPENDGFIGDQNPTIIQSGRVLSRYGDRSGRFLAPAGTSIEQRSLPIWARGRPYEEYQVLKPLQVNEGQAAPHYLGQSGQGTQYMTERTIQQLIDSGYLAPTNQRR